MIVWENLDRLFEKLNAECVYLILRNYESMDRGDLFCTNHEDIDILCDDCKRFIQVSGAKQLYGEGDSIHLAVNINGTIVPVDLRCVGDDYYDKQWEKDMLATRKYITTQSGSWYVMSDENYYYSLVYHVLLQKKKISEDYPIKLETLAKSIKIDSNTREQHLQNLIGFLKENSYACPYPQDISVPLNAEFLPDDMIQGEVTAWEAGREILHPTNKKVLMCNKIQHTSELLQKYVSGVRKSAFLTAFFVGLIIHWKMFLGDYINVAELALPGLYIVILLAEIGVQAMLLTDLFAVKNKYVARVIGGLTATCPMIAEIFVNTEVGMQYCVAHVLAIASVRIFFSDRKGHIIVSMGILLGAVLFGDLLLLIAMCILCIRTLKELIEQNEKRVKNKLISVVTFAIIELVCFSVVKIGSELCMLQPVQETQRNLSMQAMTGSRGLYVSLTCGVALIICILTLKDKLKRFHILRGIVWGFSLITILGFIILTGKIYG